MAQLVKNLPVVQETGSIPGSGRSSEEESGNPPQDSCLRIPWTEEPGGLQSTGSQRVRHDGATKRSLSYLMDNEKGWNRFI